jgi:hypothetical protein
MVPELRSSRALAAAVFCLLADRPAEAATCVPVHPHAEALFELSGAREILAADFDRDGRPDLVAAGARGLQVARNAGGGHFDPPVTLAEGTGVFALGDFDSDGNLDIAFADATTMRLEVYPGDGRGSFGAPLSFAMSAYPVAVAAGDFDANGATDLAVVEGVTLVVRLQRQGSLTTDPVRTVLPISIFGLWPLDFDGDGRTDLLIGHAQFGGSSLGSSRSRGDGTFAEADSGITGGGYHLGFTLSIGDFDTDGLDDAVVASSGNGSAGTVHLFHGVPGGFEESAPLSLLGTRTGPVALKDINDDGDPDILVVEAERSGDAWITTFVGDGTGAFTLAAREALPVEVGLFVAADFDGDGHVDLVVAPYPYGPDGDVPPLLLRGACPASRALRPVTGAPAPVRLRREP